MNTEEYHGHPIGEGVSSLHIHWRLLDACNYGCPQCGFAGIANLAPISRSKLLEVAAKVFSSPKEIYTFEISGGEPTLHPNLPELIHFLSRVSRRTRTILHTNGWRDLAWYRNLMDQADTQRLEIRICPIPGYSDLRHLLVLASEVVERGYSLTVNFNNAIAHTSGIFEQAFAALSQRLPFSLVLPERQKAIVILEDEGDLHGFTNDAGSAVFRCLGINEVVIDQYGNFTTSFERLHGSKKPLWLPDASLLDVISIESCSREEITKGDCWFDTLADAENFKEKYLNEQARQALVLPAVVNPLTLDLTTLQAIEMLVRRIAKGEELCGLIDVITRSPGYFSRIYAKLSDQESLDVFSSWLRHIAAGSTSRQLQAPSLGNDSNICGTEQLDDAIHQPDKKEITNCISSGDVLCENHSGNRETSQSGNKIFSLRDSGSGLSNAARKAILYGKPDIRLGLPVTVPGNTEAIFWCLEKLEDYAWVLKADETAEQFWLAGTCTGPLGKISDGKKPLLSVILLSPVGSAGNIALLDFLLSSSLNLDIIIVSENEKEAGPFDELEARFPSNLRLLRLPGIRRAQQCNTAMAVARAEYVLFSDQVSALKPGALSLLADQLRKDSPDIIMCSSKACTDSASDGNALPITSGIWCNNVFRREFIATHSLQFRDVEPLERMLFNLEANLCANTVSHSWLNMGQTSPCTTVLNKSWFANFANLVSSLNMLCGIDSSFANNSDFDVFIDRIMTIFWPLIQDEFQEAKMNGRLEQVATKEVFATLGCMPQLTQWVVNRCAEDSFGSLTIAPVNAGEKEGYLQELQLTDNPRLRPDQAWDEYNSVSGERLPEEPFFSIIMPNYNKGDYIEAAAASALDQSFSDFELLIVDDASTDGSYEKCKNLADLDGRIRLWRMRHNSMQGVCRNKAVQESRGKYIIFLDSDDILHPGFLAKAHADVCGTDAQMVVYGVQEIDAQGTVQNVVRANGTECEGEEVCSAFWSDCYPWGPWAKVYDGNFVRESNIRFEEYIYHQDVFFLTRFAQTARKITARDEIVYSCRLTPNSSVRPARLGYRHLHSAIAKLGLRNSCFENGHIHREWLRVAQDALYTMQVRILPAIARAFGMHGAVPLADTDLFSLANNPIAQFALYANCIYAGLHKPSYLISSSKKPALDREGLAKVRSMFALPDPSFLDLAASLSDPGVEPVAQSTFLKISGVFDADYYFASNEDLKMSSVDPCKHYCERWQEEQWRNPAPWFSTRAYLAAYPDVATSGMNPFIHYLLRGRKEGREPMPEVSSSSSIPMYCRDFESLLMHKPEPGTILLVEANNCHCDIPPGWVNYFSRLGYKVNAVILPSQAALDPFCRCEISSLRCWAIPYHEIGYLLQNGKFISQYEYIFFNSYTLYKALNGVSRLSVFEHFPKIIKPKNGFLAVMHHMELWDKDNIGRDSIITLTDTGGQDLVVNPHHFGKVRITGKRTGKAHFIVVGAMEADRRNIPLLLEAARELIARSCTSFYITFIGRGVLHLPPELARYAEVLGEVSYPEMFKKMEDACFFLPMLDPENSDHERYLKNAISGSFMLAYCFRKPMIIAEKFASKYGLNADNALMYRENKELADTLEKAINMDAVDHKHLCDNMSILSDRITSESINNLQRIINQLK